MKTYCPKCKKGIKKCVCKPESEKTLIRVISCDYCNNPSIGRKIAYDGYTAHYCNNSECESRAHWATSRV